MTYAIDFDGTLCRNLYPKIGAPIKETVDFCKRHKEAGDALILWTCRSGDLLTEAVEWCNEQGLEFDAINENTEAQIEKYGNDTRKVGADFYIDDKNMKLDELEQRGIDMPLKINEREYRNLAGLTMSAQQKRFDTEFYVEGYAATFEPYAMCETDGIQYFEQIDRHAFDDADLSDIIMQYDHRGRVFARSSNNTLLAEVDDHGFFIAGDLSKSAAAKEMHGEIREGLVTKMSWAFTVAEDSYNQETRTRTILKVKKVYDVSAVSIPANDGTEISARSFVDGVIQKEQQELLERRRQKQQVEALRLKLQIKEVIK